MMRLVPRSVRTALGFTLLGVLIGAQLHAALSPTDAVEQFKKMKRAFLLISGKYVEQVSAQRLATGGVNGMLDRLDPYSSYVPPADVAHKRNRIRGAFGGVGIRYNVIDDTARVVASIEGGPSAEAGIRAGDRIVEIEDSTAVGLSSQHIQTRLTGREGTTVTFTVYRPVSGERLDFTLRRGEVPLPSVRAPHLLDDQTGYLKIGRFARSTPDEFVRAVSDLKRRGMTRLVLDLRGNTGGVLEAAARVADELLGEAGRSVVRVEGRADAFLSSYRVPDRALSAFWTYAQEKEVLTLTANPRAVTPSRQVDPASARAGAERVVRLHVKGHLANVLFGAGAGLPLLNRTDPIVKNARTLWSSSQELADYHSSSGD